MIPSQNTKLLFIDSSVQDAEVLLQGLKSGVKAIALDPQRDGVIQITEVLREYRWVETVHILSHGSPGCLYLGNTKLDLQSLDTYSWALTAWFERSLPKRDESPSVVLYGCNVAAGDAGEEFLSKLNNLTGAHIAASASPTGHTDLGGDWNLEYQLGSCDIELPFHTASRSAWQGVLMGPDKPTIDLDVNDTPPTPGAGGFSSFSFSAPIVTNDGQTEQANGVGNGETALFESVGTFNGTTIDIRATVVNFTISDPNNSSFNPTFNLQGDNANVNMSPGTGTNGVQTTALVRWEAFEAGTVVAGNPIPIAADFTILITDLDANGNQNNGFRGERISISEDAIDGFVIEGNGNSDLTPSVNNGVLTFQPSDADPGTPGVDPTNAVQLIFSSTSSFEIFYDRTGAANFTFDGNFTTPFFPTPETQDTNPDFAAIFTEGDSPVSIAKDSIAIVDDGQIDSATITITNAQPNDRLVQPTNLPTGISIDQGQSNATTIRLTGLASPDDYETAIRAIGFENTSSTPDTDPIRTIEIQLTDDAGQQSDPATTFITVVDVPGATDTTPPTVDIQNAPNTFNTTDPFEVTFEFSEDVTDFALEDITVGNGSASNFQTVDGNTYTADITPDGNGNITIDVASAVAQDAAGNDNTAAPQALVSLDTDGDGVEDILDFDDDNDGITDADEGLTFQTFTLDQVSAIPLGNIAGNPPGLRLSDSTGQYVLDIYQGSRTSPGARYSFNTTTGRIGDIDSVQNNEVVEIIYTTANSPIPFRLSTLEIQDINSLTAASNSSGVRDAYAWSESGSWTPLGSPAGAVVSPDPLATDGVGSFIINDPDGNNDIGDINNFNQVLGVDSTISEVLLNMAGSTSGHTARFEFDTPQETASLFAFNSGLGGMRWDYLPQLDIAVQTEMGVDTDGDGIDDHLDLDSDNDGISDLTESGQDASAVDTNNDGVHDGTEDDNGVPIAANGGVDPINSDTDAIDDFRDLDSDNDGIPDTVEARPTSGYMANDGDVRDDDSDFDGVIDAFDTTPGHGGSFTPPVNTDSTLTNSDSTPDYLDDDSDGDGDLDSAESGLTPGSDNNGDGIGDNIGASYSNPEGTIDNPPGDLASGGAIDPANTGEVDYRLDNLPPTAVNDTGSVTENGTASINLTANDTDTNPSDDLEISGINTSGTQGSVTINSDSDSVTYNAGTAFDSLAVGQTATDTFTYTVTDGDGGTDTATVTVTITGENDLPVLDLNGSDGLGVDFSSQFTEGLPAVAITDTDANVFDIDGDSFQFLKITPGSLQDGAAEVLSVAGESFVLNADLTEGGVTIPGTSTVVDIAYQGGVFTITEQAGGPLTTADLNTLIRGIRYENTSDNPTASPSRTFELQVAEFIPSTILIDFEELTPGTRATAAQIESDPYWGGDFNGGSSQNGFVRDTTAPGLGSTADGTYLFHNTGGSVPTGQDIVFGRSGIAIQPNTDYTVSLDLGRQNNFSAGPFDIEINGTVIGTVTNAELVTAQWRTFTFTFNSGASTTANFVIRNQNTNGT
ncbi:MAG: DUF4347 domain-containing protein, partial [Cyanobacteria bacterium J06642_12]